MGAAVLALLLAALAEPPPAARHGPADARAWRQRLGAPAAAPVVRDASSVLAVLSRSPLPEGRILARVREEGLGAEFARVVGGRSLAAEVEVDCATRAVRLRTLKVHAEAGLRGPAVAELGPLPGWRRPSGGLTMGKAVDAVCGPARIPPAELAAAAPPPRPSETGLRDASPPLAPSPPAPPPLRPVAPSPRGAFAVQVGAADGASAARALLAEVRRIPAAAGLAPATEPVTVGGRRYVRALLRGLPDRAAAQALCAGLAAQGRACLVRAPLEARPHAR